MTGFEAVTVEAELVGEDAERDIAKAVSARHSIARKYVMRIRRRHPEASPAQVIQMLERHYATSITTAGALMTAGAIAADIGIALIPGVGAAAAGVKSAGQQAAKKGGKEAAKLAAKQAAKMAAKGGATRAAALLPAGDEQLQFELTAIFALGLAEIHGMKLDQDQAHTLVYGLSNERVSQQQIAAMATDLAEDRPAGVVGVGNRIAAGRADWSHWATTLSDALPGGAAQSLVRTMQTGQLDTVRETLSGKQQATVEYGVGALAGGVARFVFGREVVEAARSAFPEAPGEFPAHLAVLDRSSVGSTEDADDSNRALAALEDAARSTGHWLTDTAGSVGGAISSGAAAVGTGAVNVAGMVTRPFRSVDIDGDGIPDEPPALTKVKDVTGAVAGKAGSVGGSVAGLFKSKRKNLTGQPDEGNADSGASERE
ncbi:hypothetical protein [Arthrobacter koreensis]|uniref:hypothetical protein n=1 Tax=Arthrobacter koreensis TaxID=199136 RepID=UPI002DBF5EB7|nr:hypothetical protein [Arthrobacter koreensis]MEB7448377.1 hypothetical protein [Arthrobacter koreensis]